VNLEHQICPEKPEKAEQNQKTPTGARTDEKSAEKEKVSLITQY
jgi:hypothetical protein